LDDWHQNFHKSKFNITPTGVFETIGKLFYAKKYHPSRVDKFIKYDSPSFCG
jgi:predicted porin